MHDLTLRPRTNGASQRRSITFACHAHTLGSRYPNVTGKSARTDHCHAAHAPFALQHSPMPARTCRSSFVSSCLRFAALAAVGLPIAAPLRAQTAEGALLERESTPGGVPPAQWHDFSLPPVNPLSGDFDLSPLNGGPVGSEERRLVARDGYFYRGAERVRLFGVNICTDAAFPRPELAPGIARQLAAMGINAVRFHHLDADWGQRNFFGLRSRRAGTRRLDPESLARLDALVAALQAEGIYINHNLLVSRRFTSRDGLPPETDAMPWKLVHTVGFWDGRIEALQREFAAQLLDHVNPHTGRRYADDPGVFAVEIVNENSLSQPFFDGFVGQLPEVYRAPLRQRWNDWLRARHGDIAAVLAAWTLPPEPLDARNLLPPVAPGAGWNGTAQFESRARLEFPPPKATGERPILRYSVDRAGAHWMTELQAASFALEEGRRYTLSFEARANVAHAGTVRVRLDHPPYTALGLDRWVNFTPEWRRFEWSFVAAAGTERAHLIFTRLHATGAQFEFRDLSLRRGGAPAPWPAAWSRDNALPLPGEGGLDPTEPRARAAFLAFLGEVETDYWDRMTSFLRDELGVRAAIIPTIVGVSTPNQMARFDAIATHGYWAHPAWFGNHATDWTVPAGSILTQADGGPLVQLANKRVVGLPFLVNEYNHCIPNPHAAEGPLALAAVASLQDWDGLFYFAYAGSEDAYEIGRLAGQFDVLNHPAIMANFAPAALLFRLGLVQPARHQIARPLDVATELDLLARVGAAWTSVNLSHLGVPSAVALVHRLGLLTEGRTAHQARDEPPLPPLDGPALVSDTGELAWLRRPEPGLRVDAPAVAVHIGGAESIHFAGGAIHWRRTAGDWATFALVSLDGRPLLAGPGRALLVLAGEAQNTGMEYNADRTTVRDRWGQAPTQIEVVAGELSLALPEGARLAVHALDGKRRHAAELPVRHTADGRAHVTFGQVGAAQPPTLWYALEIR